MSTTHSAPASKPPVEEFDKIKIYSHSNLFYWWPVWFFGFAFGIFSMFDHHRMVVIPYPKEANANDATQVVQDAKIEVSKDKDTKIAWDHRDAIVLAKDTHLSTEPDPLKLRISSHASIGVWFLGILLIVVVITNTQLRGVWSVLVIVTVVLLVVILSLAHYHERTLLSILAEYLAVLDVRINAAGYFFLSSILLIIWAVTFFYFDHQTYIVFTPGQLRVCTEIGGGEKAYDTAGMTLEKHRSDFFRHKILGGFLLFRIGSGAMGDLVVNTSGAAVNHFELPNVWAVGKQLKRIEDMLREKAVVRGSVP